ncbi:MAG: mannitol dehydrogenase family protein [Eubacteriales bacterium]|nr:mannitol dehydrogenase family protein [Eubacteriales bacterium]
MKLNLQSIQNTESWTAKGYKLPQFDIEAVTQKTIAEPMWMHFGAGNIFRAFTATVHQQLLNQGLCDRGIIVGEAFDEEIIDKAYTPFDNLSLTVTLNSDGNIGKEVVASVVHAVKPSTDMAEMIRIFKAPSLQMVSFTITEKGYSVKGADGQYFKWIAADFDALPMQKPSSLISLLTMLVFQRYLAGQLPIALVSMDNCSHNGTMLYNAVMTFANEWRSRGLVDEGFLVYLKDPAKVSFNWSMIDKITPRPADVVVNTLKADGFEDTDLIITAKNTYTAAFVNAEPTQYLVIEDWFPNGRPALENGGVLFTDRATVDKIETMKVTTCLNPLHTVMAIYGCLLNIPTIADIGADPHMKAFIEKVGFVEGMPVVVDPGIIKPMDFIKTVVDVRFPNPYLPDAPQRIATDTSQKIPVRFGVTIKSYLKRGLGEEKNLRYIPLFFAGWLRYLLAVDDQGAPMTLSPDPMLEELQGKLAGVKLGDHGPFDAALQPILKNDRIFGVDLYEVGLAELVIGYFSELVSGPGAVRQTLNKYLG